MDWLLDLLWDGLTWLGRLPLLGVIWAAGIILSPLIGDEDLVSGFVAVPICEISVGGFINKGDLNWVFEFDLPSGTVLQ